MKKIVLCVLSSLLVFTAGCSLSKFNGNSDKPIIKVNNAVITQGMFDKALASQLKRSSMKKNVDFKESNDDFLYSMYKTQAINKLVSRELIKQEAVKNNITVTEDEVKKAADKAIQEIGGNAKLEAGLKENNVTKEHFMENIKYGLIVEKLIAFELKGKKVTDQDVKDFYNKNKVTKFTAPELVKAQQILIGANEQEIRTNNQKLSKEQLDKKVAEDTIKAKAKAEKVFAETKANPDKFDELVKKYSDDKISSANNGDLGLFSKVDMSPEISKLSFSLQPGEVGGPVKTNFGYHIIKVTERKKANVVPFETVKPKIEKYLNDHLKSKAFDKILANSQKTSKIVYLDPKYNPELIGSQAKKALQGKQGK